MSRFTKEELARIIRRSEMRACRPDVVVGIDPDVDKNGIAALDCNTKHMDVCALRFPELIEKLKGIRDECVENGKRLQVYIEAGWLVKSNWHLKFKDNPQMAAAKGNAAGRNHETGRKIQEMCDYMSIPNEVIRPLLKVWRGEDRKITKEELEAQVGQKLGRTNQEMRDAALIAWTMADIKEPIKFRQ